MEGELPEGGARRGGDSWGGREGRAAGGRQDGGETRRWDPCAGGVAAEVRGRGDAQWRGQSPGVGEGRGQVWGALGGREVRGVGSP